MNRTNIFFGESHSDWLPVRGGESGDFVFRRGDGHAFAKIAPASRRGELAGERDRLIWLKGRGVACPEVINWQEEQEGACLVITAIPGVPAADLSGADLLKAWPSMGQQLGAVHSLSVDQCPFERRLSRMFGRAVDVVSRNAVNPDFLPDEDKSTPQQERQKAAREAERGREAWTLGQGMKKPVAGCYGRLTRWKGGGDVVYSRAM